MSIKIIGTGSYLPEKVLTNQDLEKMVETSDEWIRTRTGIAERHIASKEQATSDLAYEAALKAMQAANISAEDLDIIIVGTITPDYVFPSTGCVLQSKLKASNAMCFDVEAACSGLLYTLEIAYSLMKVHKKYKRALVIGAEKLSGITDWEDRNTCVLFGDGAGAIILENVEDGKNDDFLIASDIHADGNYTEILQLPAGGSKNPATLSTVNDRLHYIHMAGKEVFKLAVNGMVSSSKKVLEEGGVTPAELKYVIPHQANERILKAVAQRLELPEEDRVYRNVDRCGNTSAASIGICFDEQVRSGNITRGDYVVLTAFGGGLTWGAILIKY